MRPAFWPNEAMWCHDATLAWSSPTLPNRQASVPPSKQSPSSTTPAGTARKTQRADGIRLVLQPSFLWPSRLNIYRRSSTNRSSIPFKTIDDLDSAVSEHRVALTGQRDLIRASARFHWWPA